MKSVLLILFASLYSGHATENTALAPTRSAVKKVHTVRREGIILAGIMAVGVADGAFLVTPSPAGAATGAR